MLSLRETWHWNWNATFLIIPMPDDFHKSIALIMFFSMLILFCRNFQQALQSQQTSEWRLRWRCEECVDLSTVLVGLHVNGHGWCFPRLHHRAGRVSFPTEKVKWFLAETTINLWQRVKKLLCKRLSQLFKKKFSVWCRHSLGLYI